MNFGTGVVLLIYTLIIAWFPYLIGLLGNSAIRGVFGPVVGAGHQVRIRIHTKERAEAIRVLAVAPASE